MRTLIYLTALAISAPTAVELLLPSMHITPSARAEEGHKHGKDEKKKLGRKTIGDYTVSVIVVGDPHDDKTVEFDVKLVDSKAEPKAVRAWVGTEDGKGSEKAELTKKTSTYVGTATLPAPLPAGSAVWIEIETDAGVKSASYSIEDEHKH
jgi:hypothetical protein